MSLALSVVLAAAAAAPIPPSIAQCSWDRPGHRAFMGDVVAAVDRYQDIPVAVRERLKARMAARRYDDIALISRDAISGRFGYVNELRDMHFADGQVCGRVTREHWPAGAAERGLVYCEGEHCIIVPTVCRNVARVTRLPDRVAAGAAESRDPSGGMVGSRDAPGGVAGAALAGAATPASNGELKFDPPSAGPIPSVAAPTSAAFEQLMPATAAPPSSTPALVQAPLSSVPLQGVIAAITTPTPSAGAVVMAGGAAGGPSPLGDLDRVLPVMAWTTPFGAGPVPAAPRETNAPAQAVPEPGTWVMWLAGLAVLLYLARRRR